MTHTRNVSDLSKCYSRDLPAICVAKLPMSIYVVSCNHEGILLWQSIDRRMDWDAAKDEK